MRPPLGNTKPTAALFQYLHGFAALEREFSIASRFVVVDHCKKRETDVIGDVRVKGSSFSSRKTGSRSPVRLPTPYFAFVVGSHAVIVVENGRFLRLRDASFFFGSRVCPSMSGRSTTASAKRRSAIIDAKCKMKP